MSFWEDIGRWSAQKLGLIPDSGPKKTGQTKGPVRSDGSRVSGGGGGGGGGGGVGGSGLNIYRGGGLGTLATGYLDDGGGGGGGGGYDPYAAANFAARAASQRQNDNTRAAADAKFALIAGFDKALKTKLSNVETGLATSDEALLSGDRTNLRGLEGSRTDNEKAEADASFANISNTLRERSEILSEVASQGAGETDLLRAQLSALRNYQSNQSEINRSYFDTLTSVNRAITSLNVDTRTSRKNLYDKAEDDREGAYANYYNQLADTWNEIFNIENSNTNVDSESSVAYTKAYGNAAANTAKYAGSSYAKKAFDTSLLGWEGQGETEDKRLSSNRAQVINLGGVQKKPEGATLRKW